MFRTLEAMSHATIITGSREKNLDQLKAFLTEQGIQIQANPDVYIFTREQLFTEDTESIVTMLSSQKVSQNRFCIISCDRMDAQVQNRLLKTIEEPHIGTYIILIIPDTHQLLPTVLSRCQIINGETSSSATRLAADTFLKESVANRFTIIESLTKNKKDEDNLSKTEVLATIADIEKILWQAGNKDEQLFTDIRTIRQYASVKGSSHRVLLDFLAMVCPKG